VNLQSERIDASVKNGEGVLMLCPDCDRERHQAWLAEVNHTANSVAKLGPSTARSSTNATVSTGTFAITTPSTSTTTSIKRSTGKGADQRQVHTRSSAAKDDVEDSANKTVCNEMCTSVSRSATIITASKDDIVATAVVTSSWPISVATRTVQMPKLYVVLSFISSLLRKYALQRRC